MVAPVAGFLTLNLALAVVGIWGINQEMVGISLLVAISCSQKKKKSFREAFTLGNVGDVSSQPLCSVSLYRPSGPLGDTAGASLSHLRP